MTSADWVGIALSMGILVGLVCYCLGYAEGHICGCRVTKDRYANRGAYTTVTTTTYCCPLREQQPEDENHDRGHV